MRFASKRLSEYNEKALLTFGLEMTCGAECIAFHFLKGKVSCGKLLECPTGERTRSAVGAEPRQLKFFGKRDQSETDEVPL